MDLAHASVTVTFTATGASVVSVVSAVVVSVEVLFESELSEEQAPRAMVSVSAASAAPAFVIFERFMFFSVSVERQSTSLTWLFVLANLNTALFRAD
jgi:hypothetical protein